MYKDTLRAAWAEINTANLDYNIKQIRNKVGPDKKIIGVVKADAYGHGAVQTAKVLKDNGINSFAVATISEAIQLRDAGFDSAEIIILAPLPNVYAEEIIKYGITPVISEYDNARAISEAALKQDKTVEGLIAADTGMGRIGYNPLAPESVQDVIRISHLSNFRIKGLFSHFSTADEADKTYTRQQENVFLDFCNRLQAAGVKLPFRTLSNSAAIMEVESAHFEGVRPGIILYGCYPSQEVDKSTLDLKPVMSVKAKIRQIKTVPAGTSISYGRKFTATRPSVIATIPVGYADGLPRLYSASGTVLVNNKVAPVAGTICMDQFMIDVTDIPGTKCGDEIIIMGSDGTNSITAEDIADAIGTINYEILCNFGQRLPKRYV